MLTPLDIESKKFKSGLGYNKKEVDSFLHHLLEDYEQLYKGNIELKDKITVLNDGIQYYKSMEETMQKALLLAEKTADETKLNAHSVASNIEKEADLRAQTIIQDAKNELSDLNKQILELKQLHETYKLQIKHFLNVQLELMENKSFELVALTKDSFLETSMIKNDAIHETSEQGLAMVTEEEMRELGAKITGDNHYE